MEKISPFAHIRTYDELEASIKMVERQQEMNRLSRSVTRLSANYGHRFSWVDVAVVAIRAAKQLLK